MFNIKSIGNNNFNTNNNPNQPSDINSGQILYVLASDDDFFVVFAIYTAIPTPTELQQICNTLGISFTDFHDTMKVYEIPVGAFVEATNYPMHDIINWKVI